MAVGMITQDMASVQRLFGDGPSSRRCHFLAHDEEKRLDLVFTKYVEHDWCRRWVGSIVKGQKDIPLATLCVFVKIRHLVYTQGGRLGIAAGTCPSAGDIDHFERFSPAQAY